MRKSINALLIVCLVVGIMMQHVSIKAAEQAGINIQYNDQMVSHIDAIMVNDTVLVPIKDLGNLLNITVKWDASKKAVSFNNDETVHVIYLDQKEAYKLCGNESTRVQLSSPAINKNGKIYVPLSYIAECLNIRLRWDEQKCTAILQEAITYKDHKIYIGDTINESEDIGNPSFTLSDEDYEYLFYVDNYSEVLILMTEQGYIRGFSSNAESIQFRGITYGMVKQVSDRNLVVIKDKFEGEKVVAIGYGINDTNLGVASTLRVNERIIFELTNGFRAHHKITPLKYSEPLSKVARAHSEDMAQKNYFSHDSLDGTKFNERISRGGISWNKCGENIFAGSGGGIEAFGSWLNSKGHRKNMLEQEGELGVGGAYNDSSRYQYYFTQDFARLKN